MVDLKVGDRVYYSIYYEGEYFGSAPSTDQNIRRIETIEPFDNYFMVTLENEKFTLVLSSYDSGGVLKGEALENKVTPTTNKDIAQAFITSNYLNYSRETVLYYKKTLSNTPQMELDWNGNLEPSWKYASTLATLKKFLKRLENTKYEELYPEDFI